MFPAENREKALFPYVSTPKKVADFGTLEEVLMKLFIKTLEPK